MNPKTNQFEQLRDLVGPPGKLVRPDGSDVPAHWTMLAVDEHVVLKGYTFRVAFMNEKTLVLEPVGLPILASVPR